MSQFQYTPDEISVHPESAIRQLAGNFSSHEQGLPEWVKNSADAYIRQDIPRQLRVIVLVFRDARKGHSASISCLDFVGMSSTDIEQYFRRWADPDAASRGEDVVDVQGGHGHGGKSYMIRMFDEYSYLHTVREGSGCRYGVRGGEIRFGYVPTADKGRDFAVSHVEAELNSALAPTATKIQALPEASQSSFAERQGFTLVHGAKPKDYRGRLPVLQLLQSIQNHPQMVRTLQLCDVYVVANGKLLNIDQPLKLKKIPPMSGAEDPKLIPIPESLVDPVSDEVVSTTRRGVHNKGTLTLRTSEKSMRYKPRIYRHNIRFIAQNDFIGEIEMAQLDITSNYRVRLYGECELDALVDYKQSDRSRPTDSPLTRAVLAWIARQAEDRCRLFEARDRLAYSQKEKDALSHMNAALDRWKNKFLDDMTEGLWGGSGLGVAQSRPQPLPPGLPERLLLTTSHSRAGVGVSFRPTLKFLDRQGRRVRSIPYRWCSSDPNVAVVDEELLVINTFHFGSTVLHAETFDGRLRSNAVPLEVVHVHQIALQLSKIELPSRGRHSIDAVCTLASGDIASDVFLVWMVGNESIARVSAAGLIYGCEPGTTEALAGDDHCQSRPATITVTPVEGAGPGGDLGRGYPRILISEVDPDPQTGEQVTLTREHPPVHQETHDVDRNVWWINSASPLARLYLDRSKSYGYGSREWRVYHLERLIEIMAKIRLNLEYYQNEEITFDLWSERWNQTVSQMQQEAVTSLQAFIQEGQLPRD